MELRPELVIDTAVLTSLCKRHGVLRLALFGSTLREDFNDDSDVDLLVEFLPDRNVGLLEISEFELELSQLLSNREVEIRTTADLSPLFRDDVRQTARPLYEAA